MIKYWPNKQGISLNLAITQVFQHTNTKVYNLKNNTNNNLYIDILDVYNQYKLMKIIINEFKLLILDLTELNLPLNNIINMKSQILSDLIEQIQKKFIIHTKLTINFNENNSNNYLKSIDLKQNLLIEYILIYFLFGSSFITQSTFPFNNLYTPKEHVQILLENFIIQLSNLTIFYFINQMYVLSYTQNVLQKYQLCNTNYLAIRSIAGFQNNLILQNIHEFYIEQPKEIYNSRYKVFLFSSQGIISKYIFISRVQDLQKLSKIQLFLLLLLEIQDILIPKIENILLTTTKITFYTVINLLGNSLIIIIKILINQLNKT